MPEEPTTVPLADQIRALGVRISDADPQPPCVRCVEHPGVDPVVPWLLCTCREEETS